MNESVIIEHVIGKTVKLVEKVGWTGHYHHGDLDVFYFRWKVIAVGISAEGFWLMLAADSSKGIVFQVLLSQWVIEIRMTAVAIVLGTYNRRALLEPCLTSIRCAVGALDYHIFVVDGGSTDGTKEWLVGEGMRRGDVTGIWQELPLTGAVRAFNLGFAAAVDGGYPYVCHFNDDAEFVTDRAIEKAVAILEKDPAIGEVAFEFDLRGPWGFETVNGAIYANFGVIRRAAGMMVARAQGDPSGRNWWNPIYRTYGADTELGVWLWKLGWTIHPARGIRVHDVNAQDELRATNGTLNLPRAQPGAAKKSDSELFWSRWRDEKLPTPHTKETAKRIRAVAEVRAAPVRVYGSRKWRP